ncbi:hypothetical protein BGX28_001753 [Mortierella sp. GBA30]|nr:hypothetical protein BGX28_001753 [Mortierella sp. GBA30]
MLVQYFYQIPSSVFVSVWQTSVKIGKAYHEAGVDMTQHEPSAATPGGASKESSEDNEGYEDEDMMDVPTLTEEQWQASLEKVNASDNELVLYLEGLHLDQEEEHDIGNAESSDNGQPMQKRKRISNE